MSASPRIVRPLLFFCAYFVGAEIGHFLSFRGTFATFWPPGGLYLTAILLSNPRDWAWYALAALIGNVASDSLCHGMAVGTVLGFWSANTVGAVIGAELIRRIRGHSFTLENPRDLAALIVASVFGAGPVSALIGATMVSDFVRADWLTEFINWWSCSVVGILLVVPVIMTMRNQWRRGISQIQPKRLMEATAILTLLGLTCAFIYGEQNEPLSFMIAPFLVWMAFRFQIGGVASSMLVIAGPAIWYTVRGHGPYGDLTPSIKQTLVLDGFLSITGMAFLFLATVVRHRSRIADEVQANETRYRDLFENVHDMIHSIAPDGSIVYVNRSWRETLGYTDEDLRTLSIFQIIHFEDRQHCKQLLKRLIAGEDVGAVEVRFVTKRGAVIYVEGQTNCRFENGQAVCTRAIFRNVTENRKQMRQLELARKELQEANTRLRHVAITDGLTHLNNRAAFQKKMIDEVSRAERYHYDLSLLMIDVDHFKQFNDSFGHAAGDDALIAVARILKQAARETDFVARFGGEEFAILLPHTPAEGASILAERIRKAVADSHWSLRQVTISVGAANLGPDSPDGTSLIRQADAALYHCKKLGRNCVAHASAIIESKADARVESSTFDSPAVATV